MVNCKEICSRWNIITQKRVRIVLLFIINTFPLHAYNGISLLFYIELKDYIKIKNRHMTAFYLANYSFV